jgi:hypothetical protein
VRVVVRETASAGRRAEEQREHEEQSVEQRRDHTHTHTHTHTQLNVANAAHRRLQRSVLLAEYSNHARRKRGHTVNSNNVQLQLHGAVLGG